jgi:hypothetical protein
MKRIGIVNVNLQFDIPEKVDARSFLRNVELPKEYVEDSFEIVKIITEDNTKNSIADKVIKKRQTRELKIMRDFIKEFSPIYTDTLNTMSYDELSNIIKQISEDL